MPSGQHGLFPGGAARSLGGGAVTAELAEALEQKKRLYGRIKEVRTLVETTADAGERMRQSERLRILREMYRDACGQAEALRPAAEKRRKKPPRSTVQAGAVGFDFFERCGTVWADLEGKTWSEFQELASRGSARQAGFLLQALRSAMGTLTEVQLACVMAYYAQKKTTPEIAQERGVNRSTVSRTLKRALEKLERCILASLKARECLGENGFDFLGFAQDTEVLTERQREYLYFLLTDGATMGEIARYLEVEKSSVSRGNRHIEANLSAVSPGLPAAPAARRVDKREWRGKSEKEIAAMLAISPAVYFRSVCRGETVGGVSRLTYEILRRRGLSARRAAAELGLTEGTVRRYWRRYEGVELAGAVPPEEYAPAPRRRKPADLRRLLSGGGTVGDSVDAETYRKMMALSAGTGRG